MSSLAMLTITAPLAAMGGSKSTSEIFTGWCRDIRQYVALDGDERDFLQNAAVCSCHSSQRFRCSPVDRADPYDCQVAGKQTPLPTRIGLNPAITGDSLGRGLPGTLTYMVVRSAASQITKAVGKSAGNGGKGAAPNAPSGGPHGRAQRRSWQHGGVCPAKRSAQQSSTNQSTSQKSSDAQSASVHTGAPQSPSQEKSAPHLLCAGQYALKIRQRQGPRRNGKVLFLSAHAALRPISRLQQRYRLSVCRMHPADPVRQEKLALRHAPVWRERQGTLQSGVRSPSLAAHESTFARDNAARPCRNVGSTIRFPYGVR